MGIRQSYPDGMENNIFHPNRDQYGFHHNYGGYQKANQRYLIIFGVFI